MTDMYFHLKEKLSCCDFPLSYQYDVGYMCYMAKCPICEETYQVNVEVITKGKENGRNG